MKTILRSLAVATATFGTLLSFPGCATSPKSAQPDPRTAEAMPPMAAAAHTESTDKNIIFGEPVTSSPVQKLVNAGYTVGYSHKTRTALWVSYHLFEVGDVEGLVRNDAFAADSRVANPVDNDDYEGSGYDRGHMAPSSPIGKRYGQEAQDATFKMTNMVPQLPGLNQRGWESLERIISTDWAENFKKLWVITGPIFQGDCKQLYSGVRVPSECYMVIVYHTPQDVVKALGVVMPQRRINQEPLSDFVVSIDQIESLTGIDFLTDLPDDIEDVVESQDATNADPSWDIDQLLKPTFAGNARTIKVKDCE